MLWTHSGDILMTDPGGICMYNNYDNYHNDNDDSVVCDLLFAGPYDLLDLATELLQIRNETLNFNINFGLLFFLWL